ncbi:unnamed protein product, partial [Bubo scandiacus]
RGGGSPGAEPYRQQRAHRGGGPRGPSGGRGWGAQVSSAPRSSARLRGLPAAALP